MFSSYQAPVFQPNSVIFIHPFIMHSTVYCVYYFYLCDLLFDLVRCCNPADVLDDKTRDLKHLNSTGGQRKYEGRFDHLVPSSCLLT